LPGPNGGGAAAAVPPMREQRWWLWWDDMSRMRWSRRRVNRMRLTEWRRELIPQVRWCTS